MTGLVIILEEFSLIAFIDITLGVPALLFPGFWDPVSKIDYDNRG